MTKKNQLNPNLANIFVRIKEEFSYQQNTGDGVVSSLMVGGPGTRVFTIEATASGTIDFRIALARIWEYPGFEEFSGRKIELNVTV